MYKCKKCGREKVKGLGYLCGDIIYLTEENKKYLETIKSEIMSDVYEDISNGGEKFKSVDLGYVCPHCDVIEEE